MKAFKDFRLKVLEIAKREINEKTDIHVDFELIKTGRKFTAIQFLITSKDQTTKTINSCDAKNIEVSGKKTIFIKELVELGFTARVAATMIDGIEDVDVKNALAAAKLQIAKGNVKNPKAMIRTAMKKKWIASNNSIVEMPPFGDSSTVHTSEASIIEFPKTEIPVTQSIKSKEKQEMELPKFLKLFSRLFN